MKYFDKTFWKMLSGFLALIVVATALIFGTRLYEERQALPGVQTAHADQ